MIKEQNDDLDKIIRPMSYKDFHEEVDIIIGEPIGHVMYLDSMIDMIMECKDKFLKKGTGIMMPDVLSFKCAFIKDEHFVDRRSGFWDGVYDIKMSTMKKWIAN